MYNNGYDNKTIQKLEIPVMIHYINGTQMRGKLYGRSGQRLVDLLNDARQFLPFMDINSEYRMVNKENILNILPEDEKDRE